MGSQKIDDIKEANVTGEEEIENTIKTDKNMYDADLKNLKHEGLQTQTQIEKNTQHIGVNKKDIGPNHTEAKDEIQKEAEAQKKELKDEIQKLREDINET